MAKAVTVASERDQDVGLDRCAHRCVERGAVELSAAREQLMRYAAARNGRGANDEPAVVADLFKTHQKKVGEIRRQRTAYRCGRD